MIIEKFARYFTQKHHAFMRQNQVKLSQCLSQRKSLIKLVQHKQTYTDGSICFSVNLTVSKTINPLNPELNPICYLLALLGANHFLHVSRIRVRLLTFRLLTSYIYGAPIIDVSRSHTTTQHSR
jgi:hypothetical protein